MSISLKTHKMLWGRAANKCAFPECRKDLVVDAVAPTVSRVSSTTSTRSKGVPLVPLSLPHSFLRSPAEENTKAHPSTSMASSGTR